MIARIENICNLKRFPLNAQKILESDSPLIQQHFYEDKGEDDVKIIKVKHFKKYFEFFQQENELNYVLCGYICQILERFLEDHYHSVVRFLIENQEYVEALLSGCKYRSVTERIIFKYVYTYYVDQTDSLELKIIKQKIDELSFPYKIKVVNQLIQNLHSEDFCLESCQNIIEIICRFLDMEYKNDEHFQFLISTVYQQCNMELFFSFLINPETEECYQQMCDCICLIYTEFKKIINSNFFQTKMKNENSTLNIFNSFINYLPYFKQELEVYQQELL